MRSWSPGERQTNSQLSDTNAPLAYLGPNALVVSLPKHILEQGDQLYRHLLLLQQWMETEELDLSAAVFVYD